MIVKSVSSVVKTRLKQNRVQSSNKFEERANLSNLIRADKRDERVKLPRTPTYTRFEQS